MTLEEIDDWFAEHRPEGISDEDWEIVCEGCFPMGTLSVDMLDEIHRHPDDVVESIRAEIENLRWSRKNTPVTGGYSVGRSTVAISSFSFFS
jgi:hypothetical protein